MKINVTQDEYRHLIDMIYIADWVLTSYKSEEGPEIKQYQDVMQKFYALAKDMGMGRSMNMVILGAASPWLGIQYEALENAVRNIFAAKGKDIVGQNLKALAAGKEFAMIHHS